MGLELRACRETATAAAAEEEEEEVEEQDTMSTIDTITITATISILTCAMLADDSLHVFSCTNCSQFKHPKNSPNLQIFTKFTRKMSQLLRESAQ
jgi:hypothetical protein